MATTLYMAISQDGFIAGPDDETPWSEAAWESFRQFVLTCDVVLVGRRTFEIMRDQDEFVTGPQYVVVTEDELLDTGDVPKRNIRSARDMPKAARIGVIGGGELNGRLASMGVLDEMILDIEPVQLHEGIKLFGSYDVPLQLTLIGSKQIGDATVQRHYKIMH